MVHIRGGVAILARRDLPVTQIHNVTSVEKHMKHVFISLIARGKQFLCQLYIERQIVI
jgi:hypothetical protein